MGEKSADTQIVMTVQTQSLTTKQLNSNGSKVFLLNDGFVLAGEFLNQFEQLITDILGYYSENGGWPTIQILDPEESEEDKE